MKQFFYFLTLFASIGTVGLVATNPKLVQQGTATAGRIAKAVSDAIMEEKEGGSSEKPISEEENLATFLADSPYACKSRYVAPVATESLGEAPPWHFPSETAKNSSFAQNHQKVPDDHIANEPISNKQIADNWPETPSAIVPATYNAPKKQETSPITLASTNQGPAFVQQPSVYAPVHVQSPIPANDPIVLNDLAHDWSDPLAASPIPVSAEANAPIANQLSTIPAFSNSAPSVEPTTPVVSPSKIPPLPVMQPSNDPFSVVSNAAATHPTTPNPLPQNPMAQLHNEPNQPTNLFASPIGYQQAEHVLPAQSTIFEQRPLPPADQRPENLQANSANLGQTVPTVGSLAATQNIDQFQISPSVMAEVVPCHGTETVARVGTQVILMCDILPQLRRVGLRQFKEQLKNVPEDERKSIPPEAKEQFLEEFIVQCYPSFLKEQITLTMIYNDFLMAKNKEEVEFFTKKIGEEFDEDDVPNLMKEFGVNNLAELKTFLKEELGSSLERERMLTVQSKIAQQWIMFSVKTAEGECTHAEMMEYYTANQSEFETKARVKWQELQVLFSKHLNEQEAWKKMVWMGNEVARGVPFDEMAKVNSEGFTASKGGIWDWTSKGSLSSSDLEKMVFTHSVDQLSPIIKTATGLHIVKVVEREDDKITPFIEAQVKIKEQIRNQRRKKYEQEYFDELQRKYPSIVLRETIDFRPSREFSIQAQGNSSDLMK